MYNKNQKINRKTATLYDDEFQKRLIKIFLEDRDRFKNDIHYINQNAFTNPTYKTITGIIKDYVIKYEYIPSYEILKSVLMTSISDEIELEMVLETVKEIKNLDSEGLEFVKDKSIKFFKQQELIKFFNLQLEDISKGVDVSTKDLQSDISKILSIGTHDNTFSGVYDEFEETFRPESVIHIPTGCKEIDEYLQGGIIKTNLVLVAASSGVGKTSVSTALAHSAAISGFKALQIFFEDNVPAIRRKHFGRATEIEARFINTEEYSERAKEIAINYEHKEAIKNNIKLCRFRNGELTPSMLKHHTNQLINTGFQPDMILIDYFECMANPQGRNIQNEWKLETQKMRELENLCRDFGCAVIVFTQGTKESASGILLTLDKIGGSAGKYQVAHMLMTLNRTQKDAEENRAELFIPKNREGKSGKVFRIHLNNGIPKLIADEGFDCIDDLYAKQRQDAAGIPPPEDRNSALDTIKRINFFN
jgi:replicative DNA helicase